MASPDSETGRLLLEAARDGNEKQVVELIQRGACVNTKDEDGRTALIIVAQNLNRFGWQRLTQIAISLIKAGADVNIKDKKGNTALLYATTWTDEDIALAIIENSSKDLDLNAVDNQGQTALMKAASPFTRMTKVISELVKRGADVNIKDKVGKTALMYAIAWKKEETALTIIKDGQNLDVNAVDNQGQTALMKLISSQPRMAEVEDALMQLGAVLEIKGNEDKETSIDAKANDDTNLAIFEDRKDLDIASVHTSFLWSMERITTVLSKHVADVIIKDNEGKTALMHAIDQQYEDLALAVIGLLKDADLNVVDNQGQTALIGAAINGMTEVALALIKRGADVNKKDRENELALTYAITLSNEDTALAIIEQSKYIDLNEVNIVGETALMNAAARGMTKVVLALMKGGADVNIKDKKGKSALMYAIKYGRDETAAALINEIKDFSVNSVDNQDRTELMKAAVNGMTTYALALIKHGANVYMEDKEGKTALMYAMEHRRDNIAAALISEMKEFSVNSVDDQGRTELMKAAVNGMTTYALALIKHGANVYMEDKEGKTALMYAIEDRRDDIAAALIGEMKDFSVNSVDDQGRTELMKAAVNGMTTYALALIKHGANVYMEDKEGKTALMYAMEHRRDNIAAALISEMKEFSVNSVDAELMKASVNGMTTYALALIKRGADVYMEDKEGKTALMYAIKYGRDETAAALISEMKEFSVNDVDNQGQTELMKAAIKGVTTYALALIKRGADVNIKDEEGQTALMHAIIQKEEGTALVMIEHSQDLDVNVVDNQGQTALMKAAINGTVKVAVELIKRDANVNKKDEEGKTALMHAIIREEVECSLAIINHSKDLDVNAVDNQGRTALMKASLKGLTNIVIVLVKNGAIVNITDREGKTALMFIDIVDGEKNSGFDPKELTIQLISACADVNMTDDKGNTALMYNVKYAASVKALIERGKALVDHKNHLGRTALFNAVIESNLSARYLVENGANLQCTDNYNVSVLSYFIHNCMCISKEMPSEKMMYETLLFLKNNGFNEKTMMNAINNAIFCKLPIAKIAGNHIVSKDVILSLLSCTAELSNDSIDLISMIEKSTDITITNLFTALEKMLDFGVDPNASDEQGNTISHYVTLVGLFDYSDEAKSCLDVLRWLETKGLKLNQKNCKDETPLFFMLTAACNSIGKKLNMECIVNMCRHLLSRESAIAKYTSPSGESVYHLLIKFVSTCIGQNEEHKMNNAIELMEMITRRIPKPEFTVNRSDDELNTPLHIWAASFQNHDSSEEISCQDLSVKILDHLLGCGAALYLKNLKGETALHVCRTWTAVKLLVKAGATTDDKDAAGRSPLLSAAHNSLFLENPDHGFFYPDVPSSELPTFWRTVMDMGFDLWSCDKNEESIISNLIKGNSFKLADGFIEIACDNSKILSDGILLEVLNALCKDDSTEKTWKSILVGKLLESIRRPLDVSGPLRSCCINIKRQEEVVAGDSSESNSVHYQIAKKLLIYRYDSAESCLHIAEGCPPLQALLSSKIHMDDVPLVIPWTTVSKRYETMLAEVARRQNCKEQGTYWYCNEPIASGAFGYVFVGIHEKDGMEVAIKKVNNIKRERREYLREIRTLAALSDCDHIVRYLAFFETTEFSYIILELMEGNLVEYFKSESYDQKQSRKLCRDVALGLKYLHEKKVIHRDLKPANILYRTTPQVHLKLADFGLSRRLDINASFTVMATGVGTFGWIAPEVLKSTNHEHFMPSDVFSLGLIFHYIMSNQKHPFSPADCTGKSHFEINNATEYNVLHDIREEGWDDVLDPEASDLITQVLSADVKERPTASTLLDHPMFWSKTKKLDFLCGVGNQEEFECPRTKRTLPLTMVEQDLENKVATIVKFGRWDDPRYTQTSVILTELKRIILRPDGSRKSVRTNYDYRTAVELVRFIRIAKAHVSEPSRPAAIKKQILEAVFLDEFPSLVIEVFKVVTKHTWDVTREEITYDLSR